MKNYEIVYYSEGRSIPFLLVGISTQKILEGVRIIFFADGRKFCQEKNKSGRLNGLRKQSTSVVKNKFFQNWKKGNRHGIKIKFQ